MSEAETHEQEEPQVTDVPEPDQEPPMPLPDEAGEHEAGEDDVQPETAQSKSEKEIEKAVKSLQAENTRHKNRVSQIMGEDAQDLVPCPRCVGFADGLIFPPDAAPVDEAQREAVLSSIGLGAEAGGGLVMRPGYIECPDCNGFGEWQNPTKAPHYQKTQCTGCGGQGYRPEVAPQSNVTPIQSTASPSVFVPANEAGPCPRCGAPNSDGKPHFCNPVTTAGVVT